MSKLTRNVTRDHLREIMAYYGTVQSVELHSALKPGMRAQDGRTATVEFEATEMCDKAIKHMDAGTTQHRVYSSSNFSATYIELHELKY